MEMQPLDLNPAKSVLEVHAVEETEGVVVRNPLSRGQVEGRWTCRFQHAVGRMRPHLQPIPTHLHQASIGLQTR